MPVCPQSCFRSARIPALVLTLMLLLVGTHGEASEVVGLYTAEVPVAGQDATSRNLAIGEAFRQVLIKVTGREEVVKGKALQEQIQYASTYVQQYRYRLAPTADDETASTASVPRLLQVQFDPQAVNRLLTEQGQPVWGGTRPLTLIWLGIEENGNRRIAMPGQDSQVTEAIQTTAGQRGLPVLMPLLDLEDQSKIQAADLWAKSAAPMREASQRYEPDLILVGTLQHPSDAVWRGHWTLLIQQNFETWESQGTKAEEAAAQGMRELADRLAAHYAPARAAGELQPLRLRITGIRQLMDYDRIERFLRSLDSVAQVELLFAEPESVVFSLQVHGGRASLEREIGLGGMLRPEPSDNTEETTEETGASPDASSNAPSSPPAEVPTLHYRLQP